MSYYIARIRAYFAGQTNMMGAELVADERGFEPLAFDRLGDARDKIWELNAERYYTQSGEAGRPSYYIIDDDCREWLESDDNGRFDWDKYDGRKDDNGDVDTLSDDYFRFCCEEGERYVKAHAITGEEVAK